MAFMDKFFLEIEEIRNMIKSGCCDNDIRSKLEKLEHETIDIEDRAELQIRSNMIFKFYRKLEERG